MIDISLEKIFNEIFGIRLSLGVQVLNVIRIANPQQSPPLKVRTSRLDHSLEDFFQKEHIADRKLRTSLPHIVRLSANPWTKDRGNFEEEMFSHWQIARTAYARSEIEKAEFTARYIKHRLNGISTSFSHRMDLHCDALLVDTAPKTQPASVMPLVQTARAITERYIRQHDFLWASVGLQREAQLARCLAILIPSQRDEHLERALELNHAASDCLSPRRCSGQNAQSVSLVSHEAKFHRARLLEETHYLDALAISELERISDSALQLTGGLGLLELTRAEASLSLSRDCREVALERIGEGCWLYDHATCRSPVSCFSFLGRILDWCDHPKGRFTIRDLEQMPPISGWNQQPDNSYVSRLRRVYKEACRRPGQWTKFSADACYVARMSSFHIEPKFRQF